MAGVSDPALRLQCKQKGAGLVVTEFTNIHSIIAKEKQLKEKLLVDCLLASSFVGKENAETEDLFPEEFYMKALKEAYPDKEVQFNEKENSILCITVRIEKAFERLKLGDFEKWKVAYILIDWIQKDSGENKISNDTCKTFEKIFTKVNELLKK